MNELKGDLPEGFKMTELGLLPWEWEVVRLGDVFNVQQGKQLSGKEVRDGKIKKPFLRTSNLSWGYINISNVDEMYFTPEEFEKLKLKKGDVLVCEGGDIGRTALYRGELKECAYQNHLHRLRPKKENIDVEFFVFWMDHAVNQRQLYTYTANRTTIPNLSSSRLKNFIFPLPPLPEQEKIAAILSAVQEAKEKTEAVISATRELKKSMMSYLFTYGPVPVVDAENIPQKETEIGMIPEEWEVVRLGDIAEKMKAGGTPRRGVNEYWGGDIPFVLIGDMTSCYLYLSKTKETLTDTGLNNSNAWLVPPNTILLSMYATIGETAINTIPVATNQAILAIVPKNNFNTVFGAYLLKYNAQRLTMQNIQSTQKNVNKGIVENFKIPLPPLPEQEKIAAILSAIDQKIEAEENKKKALEDLFKTLLHNLMTAKIRVNNLEVGV